MWLTLFLLLLGCSFAAGQADCGRTPIPPIEAPDDANIIGGVVARPYSWPWQVALECNIWGEVDFCCSGTIITDQWIMTAVHCFIINPVQVKIGLFKQTDTTVPGEQLFNITDVHFHPKFSLFTHGYDIALLKLDRPIVFSDHVQPVCLPAKLESVARAGDRVYATGWGKTKASEPEKVDIRLRQVALPLIAAEECERDYPGSSDPKFDRESMICAGYGGHAPCNGDSGGPLTRKHNESGKWYQIGITSWGSSPCAEERKPIAYTHVAHMCDFIEGVVGSKLCETI